MVRRPSALSVIRTISPVDPRKDKSTETCLVGGPGEPGMGTTACVLESTVGYIGGKSEVARLLGLIFNSIKLSATRRWLTYVVQLLVVVLTDSRERNGLGKDIRLRNLLGSCRPHVEQAPLGRFSGRVCLLVSKTIYPSQLTLLIERNLG